MNIRTISFRRNAARKILSLLLLLLLLPLLLSSCTYFSSYHRPINMRNNSKFSCLVQIIFQDAIFIVFVTQWNTTSIKLHLFSRISLISSAINLIFDMRYSAAVVAVKFVMFNEWKLWFKTWFLCLLPRESETVNVEWVSLRCF